MKNDYQYINLLQEPLAQAEPDPYPPEFMMQPKPRYTAPPKPVDKPSAGLWVLTALCFAFGLLAGAILGGVWL